MTDREASAKSELDTSLAQLEKAQDKLKTIKDKTRFIAKHARHYDDAPEYSLPEPKSLMSAKIYYEKVAFPLVRKLKNVVRSVLLRYFEKTRELSNALDQTNRRISDLSVWVKKLEPENERLRGIEKDYRRLRNVLGNRRVDELLHEAKEREIAARKPQIERVSTR